MRDNELLLEWMGFRVEGNVTCYMVGPDGEACDIPDLTDKQNMWMLWEWGVKKIHNNRPLIITIYSDAIDFNDPSTEEQLCYIENDEPHLALYNALLSIVKEESNG